VLTHAVTTRNLACDNEGYGATCGDTPGSRLISSGFVSTSQDAVVALVPASGSRFISTPDVAVAWLRAAGDAAGDAVITIGDAAAFINGAVITHEH
jgi:hypothetical protein